MDSQLIWVLVVAVIGIVNWVIKKSAEAKERQRQAMKGEQSLEEGLEPEETFEELDPPYQLSRQDAREENQQESMRRLMDALGLPAEAPPPLPVSQPRAVAARLPEPVSDRPSWTPPKIEVTSEAIPGAQALAERFQKSTRPGIPTRAVAPSGVREMLSHPGSLREAMILREILGPPKGLSL